MDVWIIYLFICLLLFIYYASSCDMYFVYSVSQFFLFCLDVLIVGRTIILLLQLLPLPRALALPLLLPI